MISGQKKRSRFRIFLKWLIGLLLIPVFSATIVIYNLETQSSPTGKDKSDIVINAGTLGKMLNKNIAPGGNLSPTEQTKADTQWGAFKEVMNRYTMMSLIGSGILFFLLFLVSYRFGKLVSLAMVFILVSLPGMVFFKIFPESFTSVLQIVPSFILDLFFSPLAEAPFGGIGLNSGLMTWNYLYLFLGALGLLVLAFIGKLLYNLITGTTERENRLL